LKLQMATNLVHNAIVHNLPDEGTVWVTTSIHPKSVVLTHHPSTRRNSHPHTPRRRRTVRYGATPRHRAAH